MNWLFWSLMPWQITRVSSQTLFNYDAKMNLNRIKGKANPLWKISIVFVLPARKQATVTMYILHLFNKAWRIWMWWAQVETGTKAATQCPVCSSPARCASLRVPLRLNEPSLVLLSMCARVWKSTPLPPIFPLITFNKHLFPSLS